MCLAIPMRVAELLDGERARVEAGGVENAVSLALVDGVAVGDYVIVHVGFAIAQLDAAEAEKTLALFAEIAARLSGDSEFRI